MSRFFRIDLYNFPCCIRVACYSILYSILFQLCKFILIHKPSIFPCLPTKEHTFPVSQGKCVLWRDADIDRMKLEFQIFGERVSFFVYKFQTDHSEFHFLYTSFKHKIPSFISKKCFSKNQIFHLATSAKKDYFLLFFHPFIWVLGGMRVLIRCIVQKILFSCIINPIS